MPPDESITYVTQNIKINLFKSFTITIIFFIAIVINMELPTKIIPLNNADEAILHSGQIGTIRLSSGSGMVSYSPCRGGAGPALARS